MMVERSANPDKHKIVVVVSGTINCANDTLPTLMVKSIAEGGTVYDVI